MDYGELELPPVLRVKEETNLPVNMNNKISGSDENQQLLRSVKSEQINVSVDNERKTLDENENIDSRLVIIEISDDEDCIIEPIQNEIIDLCENELSEISEIIDLDDCGVLTNEKRNIMIRLYQERRRNAQQRKYYERLCKYGELKETPQIGRLKEQLYTDTPIGRIKQEPNNSTERRVSAQPTGNCSVVKIEKDE